MLGLVAGDGTLFHDIIVAPLSTAGRNCLREVRASLDQKKPIVLVNEADKAKGGQTVAEARAECPEDLRALIFDRRDPITWLRIADFQLLSLKLICHQILKATPLYSGLSATGQLKRAVTGPSELQRGLYVPGELQSRNLTCEHHKTPVSLFCSPNNPGARDVGEELAAHVGGVLPQDANRNADVSRNAVAQGHKNATHMLLYLDRHTWLGAAGDKLAKSVAAARAQKLPIILVHEQDESRGACEFSQFFEITPQALLIGGSSGLYASIAIPLYAPPHRAIGLAMAGLALGATDKPDDAMALMLAGSTMASDAAAAAPVLMRRGSTMASDAAAAAVATVLAAADDIHISERMSAAAEHISEHLEAGVNFLEHASGLDLDRDGDSGGMGTPADAGKSEQKSVRFAGTESQAVVTEALPTPSVPVSEHNFSCTVVSPQSSDFAEVAQPAAAVATQPVAAAVQSTAVAFVTAVQPAAVQSAAAVAATAAAAAQPVAPVAQPAAIVAAAAITVAAAAVTVPEPSPRRRRSFPLQQQGAPSLVAVPAVDEKIGTSDELAGAISSGLSVTGASGRSRRRTSSVRPRMESTTQEAHEFSTVHRPPTKEDQSSA